jgi:hypothetical protein
MKILQKEITGTQTSFSTNFGQGIKKKLIWSTTDQHKILMTHLTILSAQQ